MLLGQTAQPPFIWQKCTLSHKTWGPNPLPLLPKYVCSNWKMYQCSEPINLIIRGIIRGIIRKDNCKQAYPSVCTYNRVRKHSEAHWADGKPHLSAKQDRLSALHQASLWHWTVFNRQWRAWATQLHHRKEEARKGPGEKQTTKKEERSKKSRRQWRLRTRSRSRRKGTCS